MVQASGAQAAVEDGSTNLENSETSPGFVQVDNLALSVVQPTKSTPSLSVSGLAAASTSKIVEACLTSDNLLASLALALALVMATMAMVESSPMMAITTNNSISVKPFC